MSMIKFGRCACAFVAGLLFLAGCEGENLFDNEQNPFIVPRVAVSAPDFAFAGDTFAVSLTSSAGLGVQQVELSLRGAVNRDTVIISSTGAATVRIGLPVAVTDTVLIAFAQTVDKTGRRSVVRADTVRIFGPSAPAAAPIVLSIAALDSTRAGRTLDVRADVRGSVPLRSVIFRFRGAADKVETVEVTTNETRVLADASVSIPATATDNFVTVTVVAVDVLGNVSALTAASTKNVLVSPPVGP